MFICKKIIKHQNIIYYLEQNKSNSRYCYIRTGNDATVAKIDNKTSNITYEYSGLPQKITNAINNLVNPSPQPLDNNKKEN